MTQETAVSRFRFIDDVDAQRLLGVDRLTFEDFIRNGRLRSVSKTGSTLFFRAADVTRLRAELDAVSAPQVVADTVSPALPAQEAAPKAKTPKQHDPAMRVHLRLTADLKWYDISDADLQAWFDQTLPEVYDRYRANAEFVISRMQRLLALIAAGAAKHNSLTAAPTASTPPPPPAKQPRTPAPRKTGSKPARRTTHHQPNG